MTLFEHCFLVYANSVRSNNENWFNCLRIQNEFNAILQTFSRISEMMKAADKLSNWRKEAKKKDRGEKEKLTLFILAWKIVCNETIFFVGGKLQFFFVFTLINLSWNTNNWSIKCMWKASSLLCFYFCSSNRYCLFILRSLVSSCSSAMKSKKKKLIKLLIVFPNRSFF